MLSGKIALVTGGRGELGRAICARFLREGATVFAADLTREGTLQHSEDGSRFVRYDVTSEEEALGTMARVEDECGKLDVLVNVAGIEMEKTIEETSLADWNRIFAVNVTGTFLASKYALPLLRRSGNGSIINFGSYDGFIADPAPCIWLFGAARRYREHGRLVGIRSGRVRDRPVLYL